MFVVIEVGESKGRKVRRLEDIDTSYRRVIANQDVPQKTREKLKAMRSAIDIFELTEQIEKLEKELDKAYQTKVGRYNNGLIIEAGLLQN